MASNGDDQYSQSNTQRTPSIRGDQTSFHRPFRPTPALQNPELQVSHIDSSANPQSPRGRGGPLQNRTMGVNREDLPSTPPTPPVPSKSTARTSQAAAPKEYNPRFSFMEEVDEPPAPVTNFSRGPSNAAIFRSSASLGTVPQVPADSVPPLPQFQPSTETPSAAPQRTNTYPESGDRPLPTTVQPSSPSSAVPTVQPKSYSDKQALHDATTLGSPVSNYPGQSQQNYIVSPIVDDRGHQNQLPTHMQSPAANYPNSQTVHTPPSSQGNTPPQNASLLHTQSQQDYRPIDTAMHRSYDSKMPTPQSEKDSLPRSATNQGPQFPVSSYKPSYNPDNPSGPNGTAPSTHQPGQIAHPNMKLGDNPWRNGLCAFGDLPTCCTGFWCPCVLYGQTQYRLSQKSDKRDPTDLLGYKAMNGNCLLFSIGCGFQWAFAWFQHTRIHKTYDIPGSMTSDLLSSFCCYSCMLMANEREVREREEEARRNAGPIRSNTTPYIAPAGMSEV